MPLGVTSLGDAIGLKVGVVVKVEVGSAVNVALAEGLGVAVSSTRVGVTRVTSDVGVEYTPHKEGVCPQDVSSRAAMQDTTT